MIFARPGDPYLAVLGGAPTGLVGTLTVQIENTDGTTAVPATAAGIVEVEPTVYVATNPAPDDPGNYILVWLNGEERMPEDMVVGVDHPATLTPDPLAVAWRPSVAEVGALLRARTKDDGGNELGTFTAATRPTNAQVEYLISQATGHVASKVGTTDELCTPELTSKARHVTVLYTALLIELTYFPEQVARNISPYSQHKVLYDDAEKELLEGYAEKCGGGGDGEVVGGDGSLPSYGFGDDTLIGRRTIL